MTRGDTANWTVSMYASRGLSESSCEPLSVCACRFVFKKANRSFDLGSGEKTAMPSKRMRGTESQGVSQMNGDVKRVKKSGPEPTEEVMKENADYKRINSDLMRRCSTLETAMQVRIPSCLCLPAVLALPAVERRDSSDI